MTHMINIIDYTAVNVVDCHMHIICCCLQQVSDERRTQIRYLNAAQLHLQVEFPRTN